MGPRGVALHLSILAHDPLGPFQIQRQHGLLPSWASVMSAPMGRRPCMPCGSCERRLTAPPRTGKPPGENQVPATPVPNFLAPWSWRGEKSCGMRDGGIRKVKWVCHW